MATQKKRRRDRYGKNVYRCLTMITQFGINMMVPIFLCFFVGYYLDRKLGTNYIMIIFFFVGALAGFRNIYMFSKKIMSQSETAAGKSRREKSDDKET